MAFATCRACDRAFTKDGWGAQSNASPRLCRDCESREVAFHGKHAPDVACIAQMVSA